MLPTYTGRASREALTALWGLPNACPTLAEREADPAYCYLRTRRVLFVDDDDHGRPVAVWEP